VRCLWTQLAGQCRTYGERQQQQQLHRQPPSRVGLLPAVCMPARHLPGICVPSRRSGQSCSLSWLGKAHSRCDVRVTEHNSTSRNPDPAADGMRGTSHKAGCACLCCCSIRHAILLDDPFDDPPQLADLIPDASPPPQFEHVSCGQQRQQ
jgi:hypothetical protein